MRSSPHQPQSLNGPGRSLTVSRGTLDFYVSLQTRVLSSDWETALALLLHEHRAISAAPVHYSNGCIPRREGSHYAGMIDRDYAGVGRRKVNERRFGYV